MSQRGASRVKPADPVERARQMAMGRMRGQAHAIDDPGRNTVQHREGRLIEFDDIGRISEVTDPEAGGRGEAVILTERPDRYAGRLERTVEAIRQQARPI